MKKPHFIWSRLLISALVLATLTMIGMGQLHAAEVQKPSEQDVAAQLARDGRYDEALALLQKLQEKDPANQKITRDIVAVESWAGQHERAVELYETLPHEQPDYVLAAIAHSYRVLKNNDKALAIYRLGRDSYPDNVSFVEGEIRCLIDAGELDSALARTNSDLKTHGHRPQIDAILPDIAAAMARRDHDHAVMMGRSGRYPEALTTLKRLHEANSQDDSITRDYLAVLGWAGGHDADVVALYKLLPQQDEPDYVLAAVGQSYRKLKNPEEARTAYQLGAQKYPDNVTFTEGAIRSLVDQKQYKAALAEANADLQLHGDRPEILDIKKYITRQMKPAAKHKGHHKKHHRK